eukprot:6214600-Pleurochrysis_carterae.AAC.1
MNNVPAAQHINYLPATATFSRVLLLASTPPSRVVFRIVQHIAHCISRIVQHTAHCIERDAGCVGDIAQAM